MTNEQFSGQLRQHLLSTADERVAEGQLARRNLVTFTGSALDQCTHGGILAVGRARTEEFR